MRVDGILLVSSFCGDCSAVFRSISWARCLPVVTAESGFFEKLVHFLTFVVKIGVVTTKAPQSKKLREWNGIFYVLWMRGQM